jgi:Fe-S cluster biogenesis protein NfuA
VITAGWRGRDGRADFYSQWTVVGVSATLLSKTEQAAGVIALLAPFIEQDGGELLLKRVDEEGGVVYVELRGACSSCAISRATLEGGVARILKERLSWVKEVCGTVDDEMDFDVSRALGSGGYVERVR